MYDDGPKLSLIVLTLVIAAILAFIGWKMPDEGNAWSVIKIMFFIIAFGFGIYGLAGLGEWIARLAIELKHEAADASYPVIVANALHGLSPDAVGLASKFGAIEAFGILADQSLEIAWRLRCDPVDVDWSFAQSYVKMSEAYYPNLLPIGRADEIKDEHGLFYTNYERQAQAFTNRLIMAGVARPGRGNQSAVLLIPWEDLAEKFGIGE